jgi:hypothetical protein
MFLGCSDATVVSHNISKDADYFKIKRRIVFFNGITDTYLMEIIGYCSIYKDKEDNQLEVTCKVGDDKYKQHYFGLSDNTAYFVEQIDAKTENNYHYKVIFKPQTIVPDITIKSDLSKMPLPKVEK